MDGQLDVHIISQLEQKLGKTRFVRVDSDTIDNLIRKEEVRAVQLHENQQTALREIFKSQFPVMEKNGI
jgi:molecular chaperone HtpG